MKKAYYFLFINLLIISSLELKAQKISFVDNFMGSGIQELEVEGRFCNVRIKGQANEQVNFKGEIKGRKLRYQYAIKHLQEGTKLKVWVEVNKNETSQLPEDEEFPDWKVFKFNSGSFTANLWFEVPKNLKVTVKNSSGRVFVEDLNSDLIHITSSSGTIHADNLIGNPIFKIRSGRLLVNNVNGNCVAQGSSGSQKWQNIQGNVQTEAGSGRLKLSHIKGDLTGNVSSGTINLFDIRGKLAVKATSGRLKGKQLLLTQDSEFNVSSGAIKLDFINHLDDFKFKLSTGSGNIRVGKSRRMSNYLNDKGKIQVVGISSSGRQRYN